MAFAAHQESELKFGSATISQRGKNRLSFLLNCTIIVFYSLSGPKDSPLPSPPGEKFVFASKFSPLNDTENMAGSFNGEGQQLSYSNPEMLSLKRLYYSAKHLA